MVRSARQISGGPLGPLAAQLVRVALVTAMAFASQIPVSVAAASSLPDVGDGATSSLNGGTDYMDGWERPLDLTRNVSYGGYINADCGTEWVTIGTGTGATTSMTVTPAYINMTATQKVWDCNEWVTRTAGVTLTPSSPLLSESTQGAHWEEQNAQAAGSVCEQGLFDNCLTLTGAGFASGDVWTGL